MKSIIKLFAIIAVIGLLSACGDDFLDQTPQQSVDTDLAISTVNDAKIALNGCYDALQQVSFYGRNYLIIGDIAADNTKMRPENAGRFLNIYNWTITAEEGYSTGIWVDGYETIDRVNQILAKIDDAEGTDETLRAEIKGEALTIRALLHFLMVNYFAQPYTFDSSLPGIPVMIEPAAVDYKPARETIAAVYTQILADLIAAEELMQPSTDNLYISKYVATALKSRVYLYMADWANAKIAAEKVMNEGGYSLQAYAVNTEGIEEPQDEYIKAWAQAKMTESIFNIGFTSVDNWSVDMLGYMYLVEGYGDILPTEDLMNLYSSSDVRLEGWFYEDGDYIYTNKFPGREDAKAGVDNIPVIRLSEVYLNYAEACANLGGADEVLAQIALGEIISRADDSAPAITETGALLMENILNERRKELAFEGHRFWDLKRLGLDVVRNDKTSDAVIGTIEAGTNNYAYPIPQREMNVNPNMVQNPGY